MIKTITIVVPTYNEEENIELVYTSIKNIFAEKLNNYHYKILFIDNDSQDASRSVIRALASKDSNVQYIFNVKNFGFSRSTFYGLTQATGDAAVLIFADMQEPPEMLEQFVYEWEQGYKVVVGIKNKSDESALMYFFRKCYYKLINIITDIPHIEQFLGFGLYDKFVIDIFRKLEDPLPYLRGIVAELAPECKKVYYTQRKRKYGKSSFNFWKLYDVAMLGITSYSKALMRIATCLGMVISGVSFVLALVTVVLKIFHLIDYPIGTAAIIFGVFFLGSVQLIFIGILGEYISNINIRTMKRPLVIEEERANFENLEEK